MIDVFLTTMKPREKVVSAHDVQSSLYYCHLTRDLDAEILKRELCQEKSQSHGSSDNSTSVGCTINDPRYPDQRSVTSITSDSERLGFQMQPTLYPTMNQNHHQIGQVIRRKPLNKLSTDLYPDLPLPSLSRQKILGPRPIQDNCDPPLSISTSSFNSVKDSTDPRIQRIAETQGLETIPTIPEDTFKSTYVQNNHQSNERYITLIRRDPSTGDQWNIGKVSLRNPETPSSPSRSPTARKRDCTLEVFGPGYAKFQHDSTVGSESFKTHLNLSSGTSTKSNEFVTQSSGSLSQQKSIFMTPWRTSCTFSAIATGRVLKCYHSMESPAISSAGVTSNIRSPSMLVSELRFNLPSLVERSVVKNKENRRPTSYSSKSLGRLSISSLSLSPSAISAQYKQKRNEESKSPRLPPRRPISYQDVSQTKPPLPSRPRHNHPVASYNQSSEFIVLGDHEDEDDLEPELDLSLGQERAGGGFRGNKAKLGKLVIYGGQGLAMLDLFVSANMGVWFNDLLEL